MILARDSITLTHVRDITATTWYYKLQASTSSPPAKPTTETPSGWSTTEPTYTEGSTNSLYTVQKTTFSDGTFEYSDVSLSSSYEAAKIAYNKSVAALDAVTPIATKTYTGLIGSANDAANASFYFAKIHPTNYTVQWNVSLRFHVTAPEAYAQDVTIRLGGYGSSFSSYDAYTVRTNSIGMYYVNLYRATQAGIVTNQKGHALGIGLRSSTNSTNSSYKRTVVVELLEAENCTVDMLDVAVKYASIDGSGSTNYTGLTEMGVASAGQNATNNANTSRTQYGSAVRAGAFGCKRYTLLIKDTEETWVSFVNQANNTGTTKTVSTGGHLLGKLLYLDAGSEYAAGKNTGAVYDAREFDFRYSSNCGSTLTAYQPVYLVGTIASDGKFYFDTEQWYTQTPPTDKNGKTYIYVGMAYSTTSVWLSTENGAYQYYEEKFRKLSEIEEMKAAKTATNYLSRDETGIMVADLNDGSQTPSTATGKNVLIDNDSVDIRNGQDVIASFGADRMAQYMPDGSAMFLVSNELMGSSGIKRTTRIRDFDEISFSPNCCKIALQLLPVVSTSALVEIILKKGTISAVSDYFTFIIPPVPESGNKTYTWEKSIIKTNSNYVVSGRYGYTEETSGYRFWITIDGITPSGYGKAEFIFTYSSNPTTDYYPTYTFGTRESYTNTGIYSVVEGYQNNANGDYSHALNYHTQALSAYQTALGKYNIPDSSNRFAAIIGNGNSSDLSNAIAVTWDGDPLLAIDDNAIAESIDGELYDALEMLGWESEVTMDVDA